MKRRMHGLSGFGHLSVRRRQSSFALMRAIVLARPHARHWPAALKMSSVID
jgi:hypothetical protein